MAIDVRAVIHFLYLLDKPDEEVLGRFENAYGEGIVNLKTAQRWTSQFRNGETKRDDKPRPR
jgi:hypothetical protein